MRLSTLTFLAFVPTIVGVALGASGCGASGSDDGAGDEADVNAKRRAPDGGAAADGGGAAPKARLAAIPLKAVNALSWAAEIKVGGQKFELSLDTGSTSSGVAGGGCKDCAGVSPLYKPGATAVDQGKPVSTDYGDTSNWSVIVSTTAVPSASGSLITMGVRNA